MDPADRRIICKVCLRQYARYTCPRCNTAYCSLPCYKQHGERCTESFYRDQAVGELRAVRAGDEQRRAMAAILRRLQQQQLEDEETQRRLLAFGEGEEEDAEGAEQDEEGEGESGDDDDDEEEGEEQGESEGEGEEGEAGPSGRGGGAWGPLATVLSRETRERLLRKAAASGGREEDWEIAEGDLSPAEWAAFQRAVALGQLGGGGGGGAAAAAQLRPWWTTAEARELSLTATGQRVVTPLTHGSVAPASDGGGRLPPPPSEPLPPLSALTRAAPSPLLTWHLVEVLYGYCYVMRRYGGGGGGGWERAAGAAAAALLALTDVLAATTAAGRPAGRRRRRQPGAGAAAAAAAAGKEDEDEDEEDGEEDGAAARLPQTAAEACVQGVERACCPPMGSSRDRSYAVSVLYDVVTLLEHGRPSVLLALEDARRLIAAAAAGGGGGADAASAAMAPWVSTHRSAAGRPATAADGAGAGTLSKGERVRLAAAERKLWFFLVWANQLSVESYEFAAAAVAAEWRTLHETVVAGGAAGGGGVGGGRGAAPGIGAGAAAGRGLTWRPGDIRIR